MLGWKYISFSLALLVFAQPAFAKCTDEQDQNIGWVFEDDGACDSFKQAQNDGKNMLNSLLYAQRHNRHAQGTIIDCRNRIGPSFPSYVEGMPYYRHCGGWYGLDKLRDALEEIQN